MVAKKVEQVNNVGGGEKSSGQGPKRKPGKKNKTCISKNMTFMHLNKIMSICKKVLKVISNIKEKNIILFSCLKLFNDFLLHCK